jgi:hypothetical protein
VFRDFILYINTPITPEQALKLMFEGIGINAAIETDIAVGGDSTNILYIGPEGPGININSA